MPKRTDISNILLIGSGPIVIGQACEFDYSGTQSCKTLKSLGYRVILINSNPATVMTDPEFSHQTYIQPITPENIAAIIKKEKIDAILPTMGGQTALNAVMQMHQKGMLEGVELLGAKIEAIKKGEDRQAFKEAMLKIGMDLPKGRYAYSELEALEAINEIGFPAIIRASFTLAGGGSGVAYNIEEFQELAKNALDASPINEILIEESLLGWKEYEMEVIRDSKDNCIIVCCIENIDPMGVHTGDSITIAPSLTLTDKEYQRMRDASFAILREIGVDTGGSNVQFAIHPETLRMVVIEMNPRVSRSSALASKATGFPIAKVATMLAVGFSLDEIKNDITNTPASFEPSLDYIVVKIPRFAFEKFAGVSSTLGTSMKSIGEVMAIGGNFLEALQKALCSLENNWLGFESLSKDLEAIKKEIRRPNPKRLLYIADAFRLGVSVDEVFELCQIDRWFLSQIQKLVKAEEGINSSVLTDAKKLRGLKNLGFSDARIAAKIKENENLEVSPFEVELARSNLQIAPNFEEVDTCAAEFLSLTPYLYSTYAPNPLPFIENKQEKKEKKEKKILIIGSGPNRIGQGIEFDYCCVHASFALKDLNIKSVMLNCNPETVSTDYDTSDTLYFEPIHFECVKSIIQRERVDGIIVHFGGQTPLKLAKDLAKMQAPIIGTPFKVIDIAEDREKFSLFLKELDIKQPKNGMAKSVDEAYSIANVIGFPIIVRPSYVLGGQHMQILENIEELHHYLESVTHALEISPKNPLLIDKFLEKAVELDVDVICDKKEVYIAGILQHIEEAGIHSGDSACFIPSNLNPEILDEIERVSAKIALHLGVVGLLNIQFAVYENSLYLIEVNPRASRTVPFLSKALGVPLAKVATRVMVLEDLKEALKFYDKKNIVEYSKGVYKPKMPHFVALKEAVFPFNKLYGSDLILGPEMKSTGEVMGIARSLGLAFFKAQTACFNPIKNKGLIFVSIKDKDKEEACVLMKLLVQLGFELCATEGTHKALEKAGVKSLKVLKISEGRPNIMDLMMNGEISMAINTSDHKSQDDAKLIRASVLKNHVSYFTTLSAIEVLLLALEESSQKDELLALQDYLK
ncbi:carbamoyl phosphate synthase large subunit [Helicobacter pylori]|uniref:Carbamoyl phosphate synthase large chain n=1 Tax=Helicobacter pylori TaxID=210 RepID=A0A4Y4XHW8_HELPX|nr:carbamoyl-phosphate synthase large subunit [Helicobacter pylori]OOQ39905.1 carbamoyl phosphate synthase large subunit [Helicobacter pylori]WQU48702.1 carbamoyl-phosphate synthase large subunit [Helicobacter pylori]